MRKQVSNNVLSGGGSAFARFHGIARVACLTYFTLAREAIAGLRDSAPGGMGHACEFETAMMQHLRPELVALAMAEVTYPDPGSAYLSTDLLGGSRVRVYHDLMRLRACLIPENIRRFAARCVA